MTSPAQPEYIITESQLEEMWTRCESKYFDEMRDAIRSRPISHNSAPEPEQCPYWKDSYNLKSDCRDQGIGKFYCSRGVEGIKEQAKREERERIAKQIEHNASNRKYHSYTTSMQIVEYLRGEQP